MPVTETLRRLRQEDCGAGGQSGVRKGKERERKGRRESGGGGGGQRKSPNPKHFLLW